MRVSPRIAPRTRSAERRFPRSWRDPSRGRIGQSQDLTHRDARRTGRRSSRERRGSRPSRPPPPERSPAAARHALERRGSSDGAAARLRLFGKTRRQSARIASARRQGGSAGRAPSRETDEREPAISPSPGPWRPRTSRGIAGGSTSVAAPSRTARPRGRSPGRPRKARGRGRTGRRARALAGELRSSRRRMRRNRASRRSREKHPSPRPRRRPASKNPRTGKAPRAPEASRETSEGEDLLQPIRDRTLRPPASRAVATTCGAARSPARTSPRRDAELANLSARGSRAIQRGRHQSDRAAKTSPVRRRSPKKKPIGTAFGRDSIRAAPRPRETRGAGRPPAAAAGRTLPRPSLREDECTRPTTRGPGGARLRTRSIIPAPPATSADGKTRMARGNGNTRGADARVQRPDSGSERAGGRTRGRAPDGETVAA